MSSKKIQQIALCDITVSHNPRCPAQALQDSMIEQGFYTGTEAEPKAWLPLDLMHELVFVKGADKTAFVDLIEKYERDPKGIVDLAASRAKEEIEPVVLRAFRTFDKKLKKHVQRYGIVAGERRILAAAYNHAKHDTHPWAY